MSSGFDKYAQLGAYHWRECDPASPAYNPPLVARYRVAAECVPSGKTVIDVGCGDGYLMSLLSARSVRVCGIELEVEGAAQAKQQLDGFQNCEVLRSSCYALPFASASFGAAVMTDVIEHLEEPEQALREVVRALEPAGILVLTTPKKRPDRVWDVRHVTEFEPQVLEGILGRHFDRVEMSYFWPLRWSNLYNTRFGWHAIRAAARHIPNPFLRRGSRPEGFGQILAVCRGPRS